MDKGSVAVIPEPVLSKARDSSRVIFLADKEAESESSALQVRPAPSSSKAVGNGPCKIRRGGLT